MKKAGKGRPKVNPNMSLNLPPTQFSGFNLNGTNLELGRTFNESNQNFSGSNLLSRLDQPTLMDEFDAAFQLENLERVLGIRNEPANEGVDTGEPSTNYLGMNKEIEKKPSQIESSEKNDNSKIEALEKQGKKDKEALRMLNQKLEVLEKVVRYLKVKLDNSCKASNAVLRCGINYFYYHRDAKRNKAGLKKQMEECTNANTKNQKQNYNFPNTQLVESRITLLKQKLQQLEV